MCYPCKHCGKCELKKPKSLGKCPICQADNEPGARVCSECGFKFPALPGQDNAGYTVPV